MSWKLLLLLGVVACLLAVVGIWELVVRSGTKPEPQTMSEAPHPKILTPTEKDESPTPYRLSDSTEALWARPQPGSPIEFPHLPAGTQMLVRIRLAHLQASGHGDKIIRSCGPVLEQQLTDWTTKFGLQRTDLEQITLFFLPQGTTLPLVLVHGELRGDELGIRGDETRENASTRFAAFGSLDDHGRIKLAAHGIWCPSSHPKHFYYGPWEAILQLPTAGPGRFSRELEQLRSQTHVTDTVTLLASPSFLQSEAQGLFTDTRRRLLDGLFAFWTDQTQAVAVGLQLEDLAFVEVRMIARAELPPRHLVARVQTYLQTLPGQVRDFLGTAQLDPYWQPLAMRFPEMLSYVESQTRIQVEGRQVALNSIAPVESIHNLLLATELSLATPGGHVVAETVVSVPLTFEELLASKVTVRFAQKSLDQAAQDIVQQVQKEQTGMPFPLRIQINGGDLEPEGITRNQQIRGFHETDVSLAEILTALVRKANPDQSVVSAKAAEQKLVWIVSDSDPGLIEITTRTAAAERGVELPEAFRP